MFSVVVHGNGMRETQTLPSSMARPGSLTVDSFGACTAALTWSAILPDGVAAPALGAPIHSSHLDAIRAQMDAALAAAGVSKPSFDQSGVTTGHAVLASFVTELQQIR